MTRANLKATVAKVLTVGSLGAALMLAAPSKAQAQGFSVGVQFGQPAYGYGDPGDYDRHERWERIRAQQIAQREAWERQQAYLQHEQWERQQAYLQHEAWERRQAWLQHEALERHERWEHDRDGWR